MQWVRPRRPWWNWIVIWKWWQRLRGAPTGVCRAPRWNWIRRSALRRTARSIEQSMSLAVWPRRSHTNPTRRKKERRMLSQSQRAAILELNTQKVSKREIARVLKVSRLTVREVLQSGSALVPALARAEICDPYRQQILELLPMCKGNLVRVLEELAASGANLSYSALTAFCRRHGIGQAPVVAAGR